MYPLHGLALFPPFPRDERLFVAMSFNRRFDDRWEHVIKPGAADAGLDAFRVDIPRGSGSVPAEIVTGIARSRLVFADLTAMDGYRNGNVMYEVGVAHASRLPEEVLLFRSDNEKLLFDVATVRINEYDPEGDREGARSAVKEAVAWALREVDTVRHLAVERAIASMDEQATTMMMESVISQGLKPLARRTLLDSMRTAVLGPSVARLLELGVLQTEWREMTPEEMASSESWTTVIKELGTYRISGFGLAVLKALLVRFAPGGVEGLLRIVRREEDRRRREEGHGLTGAPSPPG